MGPHIKTALISVGVAAAALAFGVGAAQAEGADETTVPAETVPAETAVLPETAVPADLGASMVPMECALLAAGVERQTATFTIGPEGCEGEVGPISFSAFSLPGGMREPHEDQVLIAHHAANGAYYGAGSYELTVDMGAPCNWQTDLYYGVDLMPTFRGLIAYDFDEREVCGEGTTTTTSLVAAGGATTTTTTTSVPTRTVAQATTTTTTTTTTTVAAVGGAAPSTSVASAGPVPVPDVDGRTLPSTGSSEMSVLAMLAGVLVAAGLFVRRLAR